MRPVDLFGKIAEAARGDAYRHAEDADTGVRALRVSVRVRGRNQCGRA
jgi:hypothetical protein